MDYLTQKKFSFSSAALPADTFGVVEFRGREGLSQCYEFQVLLVSGNPEIDLLRVLDHPATFTIHRQDGRAITQHGILLRFEQLHAVDNLAFYQACLVPRLFRLSLGRHSQVFLDQSVPDLIAACLREGGLAGRDFEFRLQGHYPAFEYVCQYNESHLEFISRWLEREGLYYFFEQGAEGEKVIITDHKLCHVAHPQGEPVRYAPPSAMESFESEATVQAFNCAFRPLPAMVRVRDYNYRKPALDISATAEVDARGRGEAYYYGMRAATQEEAKRLARLLAERLHSRREIFEGNGSVPFLTAGFTFSLKEHYRDSCNQDYLTTTVWHEGSQAEYLSAGLTRDAAENSGKAFYRNRFQAIPAGTQYRPELQTPRPKIMGTISACVDAAGSGLYADLDEFGRYKVILPFDLSGRRNGKASAWFRMATPYAGSKHGLHFPLHKGTEVLLVFEDGDPDRPVIAAAVPNPEHPSPVTGTTQTAAEIRTGSGNRIHFEDRQGHERILLHAPAQSSFIRIGAPNDPPPALGAMPPTTTADPDTTTSTTEPPDDESWNKASTHWGIAEITHGTIDLQAKARNELIIGMLSDWVFGVRMWFTFGVSVDGVLGIKYDFQWPEVLSRTNFKAETGNETFKTQVRNDVNRAMDTKFAAAERETIEQVRENIAGELDTSEEDCHLLVEQRRTAKASIRSTHDELQALAQSIQTLDADLTAVRDQTRSMGAALRNAGAAMRRAARRDENTGAALHEPGAALTEFKNASQTAAEIFIE